MFEILVIDDDKNTRRLMNAILLGAGYTPVLAEDGEKALEIYNTHHVDMVIADIMMPNLDGYEFTKILRKSNQDIPIIMVSAKELPDDRKKGFKAGIDDYLVKPVDEEELLLHIKAVPQLMPIIEVLDDKVRRKYHNHAVYIIDGEERVHMAHIDIHYTFSVNGVASLHTEILEKNAVLAMPVF